MICQRANKGFTLIEVVVAVALMVILFAMLFGPMLIGFDYFHKSDARVDVRQNAAIAMDAMVKDIREAMHVYMTDAAGASVPTDTPGTCLSIIMPGREAPLENALGTYNPLEPLAQGDLIRYFDREYEPGKEIRLTRQVFKRNAAGGYDSPGTNALVGGVETTTTFTYDNKGLWEIDLTVQRKNAADGAISRLHLRSRARPVLK